MVADDNKSHEISSHQETFRSKVFHQLMNEETNKNFYLHLTFSSKILPHFVFVCVHVCEKVSLSNNVKYLAFIIPSPYRFLFRYISGCRVAT